MLKVWIGDILDDDENYIQVPSIYFDSVYEDEWILTDFTRKVISDIDKSEVVDIDCIRSPILGAIPITRIAGGTKAVILMNFRDDLIINASSCGDNCVDAILDIAEKKDLTIRLGHIMNFPKDREFTIEILNTGKIVHEHSEFVLQYLEVVYDRENKDKS